MPGASARSTRRISDSAKTGHKSGSACGDVLRPEPWIQGIAEEEEQPGDANLRPDLNIQSAGSHRLHLARRQDAPPSVDIGPKVDQACRAQLQRLVTIEPVQDADSIQRRDADRHGLGHGCGISAGSADGAFGGGELIRDRTAASPKRLRTCALVRRP